MKKNLLFSFLFFLSVSLFAQLDKVVAIRSVVHNSTKLKDLNIIVNTKEFTNQFFPLQRDSFFSTVQLTSITEPFPPKWYQIGKHSAQIGSKTVTDFYIDPDIQSRSGHLTFNFNIFTGNALKPIYDGYLVLDTVTFQAIDTITERTFTFDNIYSAIDQHEYKENEHGNKMLLTQVKAFLDVRCLSGNPADSLVPAIIEYIVVLDSLNQLKLVWNPLEYMSPCEMRYEWRNESIFHPGYLNWSHANSVDWSNDGNILYSFRHIGVGKINSTTGKIMFRLGGKDTIHSIPLPDSIGYSLQHDFYQRPDGKYSLFSNGDDSILPYLEGLIYDIDEANRKAQVVDRYRPQPNCKSKAMGSFNEFNGLYFLNRGLVLCPGNQLVDIVNVNDKSSVAEISSYQNTFTYQAHPTTWNISKRPKVTSTGGQLVSDSTENLYDFTWYKINNLSAEKVGNGLTFSPSTNGKYVVEAKIGSGYFISYLVSDPINFVLTNVKNASKDNIDLFYNTSTNMANIDIKETAGLLRIYNLNGQKMDEINLNNNHSEIYFKANPGIYLFEVTTDKSHIATKVMIP